MALFWPFSRIDWLLARIISDQPVSCLRNHIFSLFWLIDCRFSPNFHILKFFIMKFCYDPKSFWVNVKVRSSEYLLLAAVADEAVRSLMFPNLLLFWWCTCFLVLFRLLLIALALIEDCKFISVYSYTWQLSCSLAIFHHALFCCCATILIEEHCHLINCKYCCDRKAPTASAQSFTLWQQATIEFTCHDNSIIACSRHVYMSVVFRAHRVHGESHIQRNTNGEVATVWVHMTL